MPAPTDKLLRSQFLYWFKTLGSVTGVIGLLTLLTFAANIILFRVLPKAEAGQYAAFIALVQMVALIGGFGQQGLITRKFNIKPPGFYDWKTERILLLKYAAPSLVLVLSGTVFFYQPELRHAIYIIVTALLLLLLQGSVNILNSQQHYVASGLLIRVPNSLILLPAALALIAPKIARLDIILSSHFIATALTLALSTLWLSRKVPVGDHSIPRNERWEGISVWLLVVTFMLPDQGIIAVAGGIIDAELLAGYAAIAILYRPIFLLQHVLLRVFSVEIARNGHFNYKLAGFLLGGSALVIGGSFVFLVPYATNLLYAGDYGGFSGLALPLALTGGLLLTETLPRSYIAITEKIKLYNRYAAGHVFIALVGLGLILYSALQDDIVLLAWMGSLIALMRSLFAIISFMMMRRQEVK